MADNILECRMRIRCPYNVNWLDVCNHKTYVRNADNTGWISVVPGVTSLQVPEYMKEWLLLTCQFDVEFDDPCEVPLLPGGDCVGQANDPSAGSGNGLGSNGELYDAVDGYPIGFDLPDAGIDGFGLIRNEQSASGYVLYRPVLGTSHTYQQGLAGTSGRGTWKNPLVEFDALYVGNSKITESIVDITGMTECLPIYFNNIGDCCTAIDVYVDGKRIATTCGPACGGGVLYACLPPRLSNKMLIRFTRESDVAVCGTEVKIGPEVPDDGTNTDVIIESGSSGTGGAEVNPGAGGIDGDGDGVHDGGTDGKLPDIGTPMFPYTCGSTVRPEWSSSNNVVSYTHYLGDLQGLVSMCMTDVSGNFTVDVLYEGLLIATTRFGVDSHNCLEFTYKPNKSGYITVQITTHDTMSNDWEYSLYCVRDLTDEEDGSAAYPLGCNNLISSTGAPRHKHWFDMHFEQRDSAFDNSMIIVECEPFGDDNVVFSVYDKNNMLVDAYSSSDYGVIQIPRILDQHRDSRDRLYVYVESELGADWEYKVHCPVELLSIEVDGEIVPWTPTAAHP